jgi:hypothetical protein
MTLRRLTRVELNNTLQQLLGDASHPADELPADVAANSGFLTGNDVATVDAERISEMAQTVAGAAAAKLDMLSGCAAASVGEAMCAKQFIASFGRRAFRRPLDAGEVMAFQQLYDKVHGAIGVDHKGSMAVLLQAMLQSPSFLYHWEVGPRGGQRESGLVKLGPYELASRLSYFLWQSMPDDALFDAADKGRLANAADVEREARRLLADPRARPALLDFHRQWFKLVGVEKLVIANVFPLAAAQAAADEVAAFVDYVLTGEGAGKLATLLAAPLGFANATSAKLYGLASVTGTAMRKVDLDPGQRAGILTQLAFLAQTGKGLASEPIYRGGVVLEQILCEQKPPPLAAVPKLAEPQANMSTREQHQMHQSNPVCAACHQAFEPLGYAFETYDGAGRWRTQDGGKPVDASGTVTTTRGHETLTFKNAVELARALAKSPQVQACAVTKVFRYQAGAVESDADAPALAAALAKAGKGDLDLRELLVATASSTSFLYRAPTSGEVLQ